MISPHELNEVFPSSVKGTLTSMTQRLSLTTLSHHGGCGYLRCSNVIVLPIPA